MMQEGGLPSQIINNRPHKVSMNMSRLTLVQALVFTLFLVMAISGLWLGYIWQDGMLSPEETQERLDETSKVFVLKIGSSLPRTSKAIWFTATQSSSPIPNGLSINSCIIFSEPCLLNSISISS